MMTVEEAAEVLRSLAGKGWGDLLVRAIIRVENWPDLDEVCEAVGIRAIVEMFEGISIASGEVDDLIVYAITDEGDARGRHPSHG